MEETHDPVFAELEKGTNRSIVLLVDALLNEAYARGSSDLHADPGSDGVHIRLRTDGLLKEAYLLPPDTHHEVIARLKILSGLRTDEHFTAQDGRFHFFAPDATRIDVRISIAPTYHGENAVLRLLSPRPEGLSLSYLGMSPASIRLIERTLNRAHGMVLVTGPTGSGKTTTLYALMRILAEKPLSLVTIEDPVEYSMRGVNQIQANARTGLTFAQGLRSILRQDPDILMVGEIRDSETAGLAVNAALTGHLVLSTLHTNDAASTLPRLLDMKIEPYLIASTVRIIIAQRLVRRVCPSCSRKMTLSEEERTEFARHFSEGAEMPAVQYVGSGCAACSGSGYRGRVGLFEVLPVAASIQDAIVSTARAPHIHERAVAAGMRSLESDGLLKVVEGQTTLEEIMRIRHE